MSSPGKVRHTDQADVVRDALADALGFCSAQDLYARLRIAGTTVGLSTVYRHLRSLAERGIADVVITTTGETTYRYCRAQGTRHHHLTCRHCGRVEEVESGAVDQCIARIAADAGYSDIDQRVEIYGTCAVCAG